MKKVIFYASAFFILLFFFQTNIYSQKIEEIIEKSYAVFMNIKSYEAVGSSWLILGDFNSKNETHVEVDLENKRIYMDIKMNIISEEGMQAINQEQYVIGDMAYQKVEGEWIKSKFLATFIKKMIDMQRQEQFIDFDKNGLKPVLRGEEEINGKSCFEIEYVVVDQNKYNNFVRETYRDVLISLIPAEYKKSIPQLDNINSSGKSWIAKDTFYPIMNEFFMNCSYIGEFGRINMIMQQSVLIFAHNEPVDVRLPEEAASAIEAEY